MLARSSHSKYSSIGSGGRLLLDLGYLGHCVVQSLMVELHAMVAGSCWILDIWDLELSLNLQRLGGVQWWGVLVGPDMAHRRGP